VLRLTLVLVLALAGTSAAAGTSSALSGADPHTSGRLEAYRRFLASGGKPDDPSLFTAASRIHRARAPHVEGADAARLAELDAAAPLRVEVVGEHAALIPAKRNRTTRPVLLERVDGTWRVDLVESEKALEPDERGGLRLRYEGGPYEAVLASAYPRPHYSGELAPVDLFGEDPAAAIARLQGVQTSASRLRLAEILLRNCWLVDEALPLYEEAVRGAEDGWPAARTFGERALLAGKPERAIALLEKYEPESDRLLGDLHRRAGNFERWQFYVRRSLADHFQKKGILEPIPALEQGKAYREL
jgi:hypothetical protein